MRHLVLFWILVIVGSYFSAIVSGFIHSLIDIRQGIIGGIAHVFFMILPFILAPIITGWVYYRKTRQSVDVEETRHLTVAIACSAVVLYALFWVGTGAWFGLIQATPSLILLLLLAPPTIAAVIFRVFFPIGVRMLAYHAELSSRKEEEACEVMADGVWKLVYKGYGVAEIAKRVGIGCASVNHILDKKRKS